MKTKSSKLKKPFKVKKSVSAIASKQTNTDKKQIVKSDAANSKDIISLILRDHEPLKKLILILNDAEASISKKMPAYTEFQKLLSQHAKAEQDSLYVHMKKEDNLRVSGIEGDVEHALTDQLMSEIKQLQKDSDQDVWMAKVKVLAELVDHHVREEESDTFKQIQKEFSNDVRTEIGEEYLQLFNQDQTDVNRKLKLANQKSLREEHA